METKFKIDWIISKIFMILLTAIFTYGTSKLSTISESVVILNTNMAVVLERIGTNVYKIEDHEKRLRHIEARK